MINIALSGGNTPSLLFDIWVHRYEHEIDWERLCIFWVDERCVPPSDRESNYRMTVLHLLSKLPFKEKNIHRIHGEMPPQGEALRYSELVKMLLPAENGWPVFDVILLGAGSDGHTASIFPDAEGRFDASLWLGSDKKPDYSDQLYVPTVNPYNHQNRISMSLALINHAQHVFFLITGSDKRPVVHDLIYKTKVSLNYPAAYVCPASGKKELYLDNEAIFDICKCD